MGGKGKKGGGYPWWEHIKSKGGKGASNDGGEPFAKAPKLISPTTELEKFCADLDGSSYPRYKDLSGEWPENSYSVFVDHVQGDAYAAPSSVRVRIPKSVSAYPENYATDHTKNRAVTDFCTRVLSDLMRGGSGTDWTKAAPKSAGWSSSKGGDIQIDLPSQFVLTRSAMVLTDEYIEARCTMGLPAHGRTIEGRKAASTFAGLVQACQKAMILKNLDSTQLDYHIKCVEDQTYLRENLLKQHGLIGFIGNGSILPRRSGTDGRPMEGNVVKFESPKSLEIELTLPHKGTVKGLGVKKGITLIVGGGFHGKSTLLQALQFGIYDKVRGDGRELVSCDEDSFKIRSEDGRSIVSTDISPFIKNLPFEYDTQRFSTKDASGSTSQAANISEAIECGCSTFLIDEDTSATNFMIRDHRMQMLVSKDKEPITPFIQKIKPLYESKGVSTILVIGGSGDFFEVADTVICMENYLPKDVTKQAKDIVKETEKVFPRNPSAETFPAIRPRKLATGHNGLKADGKTFARNLRCIAYGEEEVELTYIEQLVELSQAKALCDMLTFLGNANHKSWINDNTNIGELVKILSEKLKDRGASFPTGLDRLSWSNPNGFYAMPRKLEIAAVINRVRSAKIN